MRKKVIFFAVNFLTLWLIYNIILNKDFSYAILKVKPQEKILIVAPHPDDELLAAGGLLTQAKEKRAKIAVVYLTAGDGFTQAVEVNYKVLKPKTVDYINFGRLRINESFEVKKYLNIDRIYHLTYPDGYLKTVLFQYYDTPFTSPDTGFNAQSYPESYKPGQPFTGKNLIENLEEIVKKEQPDIVVFPSVLDNHPDHSFGGFATSVALRKIGYQGKTYTYLVHSYFWPNYGKQFKLPRVLTDNKLKFTVISLNDFEHAKKAQALALYRSQRKVIGAFMQLFAKEDEVFLPESSTANTVWQHGSNILHVQVFADKVFLSFAKNQQDKLVISGYNLQTGKTFRIVKNINATEQNFTFPLEGHGIFIIESFKGKKISNKTLPFNY
ncbi:PIG-L deacetylase family protein [Carboxydothermus ferrireducens]|uniref:LmbE family N-acetylglucosaminyl deacetylase n=1 Tax=Carboxydothermus ferrireducens DSM 11255 TaxID=1119529 RepID=A0ABX2RBL0_9THEO|nr:PIG-L family deacetylase [Carboxydothermus ferrireducens]NYE58578.1 LmbE family N-acetylglucosaminyl deacetylase [Carboxydothermus ferrireducens DSM 11255]